ncbi:MAG: hypothetical protein JWQ49_2029 [Edaphobacter sp.]|nr:hypothetical protein [Edaphobacter sp.]
MSYLRATAFSAFVLLLPLCGICQQEPMPEKLSPEAVKALQAQEKQLMDSIAESNKHPGPKFTDLQCRADAQKWTSDPFDGKDARNLSINTAIMVNGQFRSMSHIAPHVTVEGLIDRAYEMIVCIESDAAFEKQFATYSLMAKLYSEERNLRYLMFILRHNLNDQFLKEDAKENK